MNEIEVHEKKFFLVYDIQKKDFEKVYFQESQGEQRAIDVNQIESQ